jgi:hypothetical protein
VVELSRASSSCLDTTSSLCSWSMPRIISS